MKEFILSEDKYKMNWVEGATEWGTVKCNRELGVNAESKRDGDTVRERYTFTNNSDRDVFTSLTDIGIYAPFNDDYVDAQTCLRYRCHTHIRCGGNVSYIMAYRMGGEPPHLGLILTQGALSGYSVERNTERMSNDRGDFILHPAPFSLAPGESCSLEWVLFPFREEKDFFEKAKKYSGHFIEIEAENYVLFEGENINVNIMPAFGYKCENVEIFENGTPIKPEFKQNKIVINKPADRIGELKFDIIVEGVRTYCRLLIQPELSKLVRARCHFIVDRQQYNNTKSHLDGDYLIYDNEEKHVFYTPENDYNAGRERVGMGILLARYLQGADDERVDKSLRKYAAFVARELVNEQTGEVYNDYMQDNSYKRLYNAPWFALFYTELYMLYRDKKYLAAACRIMEYFYENGGGKFYAIELPILSMTNALKNAGMTQELTQMTEYFRKHADFMLETGTEYPKSEVNYEQSIVAPAARILEETYLLTGDEKYLAGIEMRRTAQNTNRPDHPPPLPPRAPA